VAVFAFGDRVGLGSSRFIFALRTDKRREALCDLGVPVGGGVLVAHRGSRRGVAEATHQLGQRGSGLGGQHRPGVAEVVPAEVQSSAGLPGRVVDLVERGRRRVVVAGGGGREQQRILAGCGVPGEVALDQRTRCGGIATSRLPASDVGGQTMNSPSTRTTPLRIFTRLVQGRCDATRSVRRRASCARPPAFTANLDVGGAAVVPRFSTLRTQYRPPMRRGPGLRKRRSRGRYVFPWSQSLA
jgi:hypothetical protein